MQFSSKKTCDEIKLFIIKVLIGVVYFGIPGGNFSCSISYSFLKCMVAQILNDLSYIICVLWEYWISFALIEERIEMNLQCDDGFPILCGWTHYIFVEIDIGFDCIVSIYL